MSAFTDYIKDLFKSEKKKQAEYNAAREELEKYVKENSDPAVPERPSLPSAPSYERMEYDNTSDDELKKRAEDELADYLNRGTSSVESEMEALKNKYDADKATAQKSAEAKQTAVEEAYNKAKEQTDNDVLKRGLARSSIAALRQSELSEEAAKQNSAIAAALSDTLSSIDSEIENLNVKKQKALNDFNISYASKLATRINELMSERDKKVTEALKYNNSLTEKEYDDEIARKKAESDLYTEALAQRKSENALRSESTAGDYGNTYARMREALGILDSAAAREAFIHDPIYRDNLNDYYYYKLYDEFGRRRRQ